MSESSPRSLLEQSARVIVKYSTNLDLHLSQCNQYICNLLLDLAVEGNKLGVFRVLLELWPHGVLHLRLKAATLHFLQSLAILEHQGVISKHLKEVHVDALYAGYVGTNVLCSTALGLTPDLNKEYSCMVDEVNQKTGTSKRKRPRLSSCGENSSNSRTLTVYTPLNINSANIKTLLRYLRQLDDQKVINIVPSALIFTSLRSSLIFKALSLVDRTKLKMLGVDFCLQTEEELCPSTQISVLSTLTELRSISLTYNYLKGHEKETNLIRTLKSLPHLYTLNLSGNLLKESTHTYVPSTLRDLVLGNTYPTSTSLGQIGTIAGESLYRVKLSDNGMNVRLEGLFSMLSRCKTLKCLDLSGNQLASLQDTTFLLSAVRNVESTLETLILSHNMFREQERLLIITEMSQFSCLTELILGPFLPDLLLSEEVTQRERHLMSDVCGRSDISMSMREPTLLP